MKNVFTFLLIGSFVFLLSCKDEEEPKVDPIVGEWELDDASFEVSGYSYYGFEGENDAFGESSYIITFNADFTYERELEDVPFTSGLSDVNDEGEWERDGEEIDLDSDDDELDFLGYSFDIVSVDGNVLVLEYDRTISAYSDAKIDEWIADGTINSQGYFTVTQEEYDSIQTNFLEQAQGKYTLEFDKQ